MKRIKEIIALLCVANMAMVAASCENRTQKNTNDSDNDSLQQIQEESVQVGPTTITENGVGPFMLDSSFLDIPPKGSFYDTILLSRFYTALMGDHEICIAEKELKKYPYADIDGYYGIGAVMRGRDTLLVVEYDEQATIYRVEILSEIFKLSNGVHVGLYSTEMFKKHNARFLSTDFFAGEGFMCYDIPNLSNNITILANVEDRYYDGVFFNSGERIAEIEAGPIITSIPLDSVKNNYVKSIVVAHNYYTFFHNLKK